MKKSNLKGIIGALIFGIISTLPWILLYVYGNLLLSFLGALVGLGAYYGYKLFGGKKDKKTALTIGIISVLSITLATFVIIPFWLMAKEGYGFSTSYFKYLYSNGEFISAIIRDYVISVIFTLLGISGVINKINKEVYDETTEETSTNIKDIYYEPFDVQVKYLEELYGKYDAFSKEKTVSETHIMSKLNTSRKLQFMLKMEKEGIVVAPFTQSYFDKEAVTDKEKAKKNKKKNLLPGIIVACVSAFVVTAILIVTVMVIDINGDASSTTKTPETTTKIESKKDYEYGNIKITLPDSYIKYDSEDENNNNAIYISSKDIITTVMLLEEDYSSDNEEIFINAYKSVISQNFNIVSEERVNVSSFNAYVFNMTDLNNQSQKIKEYLIINNNKVQVVMFVSYSASDEEFEEKCNSYISTVSIKNN